MKNKLNEELKDIKYLFNYNRGRVISEQEQVESEDVDFEEIKMDEEWNEEEEDLNYLKDETFENREIETPVRPGIKTPTKPNKPGTPYRPKPGPKKNPKARKEEMPDWLTFDKLGINIR